MLLAVIIGTISSSSIIISVSSSDDDLGDYKFNEIKTRI